MISMLRNEQTFYYSLYDRTDSVKDENGNDTSEKVIVYKTPVEMKGIISTATGTSEIEVFGNLSDYDRVITVDDMSCPIDETTVLFVDITPEFNEEGVVTNKHNYIVKRKANSLNCLLYAIRKVDVR